MSSKTSIENNAMQAILEKMNSHLQAIYEGGGKKAIAKQKEKNKLTARERINYLIDKGSEFAEIGAFAGFEMYEEQGGCPAGGTVAGTGYGKGGRSGVVGHEQNRKKRGGVPLSREKKLSIEGKGPPKKPPLFLLVGRCGGFFFV